MVRFVRVLSLLALASFYQSTFAQAARIDFSGTFSQLTAAGCVYCGPYTATIWFDPAAGLFEQTGADSYYFTPIDPGYLYAQFSNGISISATGVTGDFDYVAWRPGLLTGNIGGFYSHLALPSEGIRYLQSGTCGSYCSLISVDQFSVSGLPVPSPIVGAGLPGIMLAIAGFIGWRRSRRSSPSEHVPSVY